VAGGRGIQAGGVSSRAVAHADPRPRFTEAGVGGRRRWLAIICRWGVSGIGVVGKAGALWDARLGSLWHLGNVVANRMAAAACMGPDRARRWSNDLGSGAGAGASPLRAGAVL
jgi:hypothetical protein